MRYWLFPPFSFRLQLGEDEEADPPPPKGGGKQNPFKYFEQNLLDTHCCQVINALPLRKCLSKILSHERESIFKFFSYVLSTYFLDISNQKYILQPVQTRQHGRFLWSAPSLSFFCLSCVSPSLGNNCRGGGFFLVPFRRRKRKKEEKPIVVKRRGALFFFFFFFPVCRLSFLVLLVRDILLLLFLLPLNIADRCPCQKRRRRWGGGKFNKQI